MYSNKKQASDALKKDTKSNRSNSTYRDLGFASVGASARVLLPKLGNKLLPYAASNVLDRALYKADSVNVVAKNPKTVVLINKLTKLLKKPLMREALISTSLAGTSVLASHIFNKINKS